MSAKIPREHPLVQQDTTHADRALEGAFLGWDAHTPAAWIYAFRLDHVVRMSDVKFHEEAMPFRDPSVLYSLSGNACLRFVCKVFTHFGPPLFVKLEVRKMCF